MTAQVIAAQTHAFIPDLDPLKVEQALDDVNLEPTSTISMFRALIPTKNLLPDDKFYVEIFGDPGTPEGGNYKSPELPLGGRDPRTLNLDKKVVAFHLGQTMTVRYFIIRDGEEPKPSPNLVLNVHPLAKNELEAALIIEAENNGSGPGLHLTTNPADLTLHLKNWPLIAERQRCWVYLEGKRGGHADHPLTVLQSEPVDKAWVTRGYREVKVPYSYFRELLDGSPLKVIVRVALNQEDDETQAFDFEERVYTVKASGVTLQITDVMDSRGNLVANTWATLDTKLTLKGTVATMEGKVDVFSGGILLGGASTTGTQWKYDTDELSAGVCKFHTEERDGVQQSDTWTVTVGAPYIESASIPNGAESSAEFVSLRGKAKPAQTFSLHKNGTGLKRVTATPDGDWSDVSTLTSRANVFEVVEHQTIITSPAWTIYRIDPDKPLP
ncbi:MULTISPECIES: hypothetical protein [unclassified Pseudomonas]|uniref:hypothetical protein n=1 Tax=unclassified Pseudomonas TaxID=196821 RepID=UPI0011AECB8B|nr:MULTISPECIES: hypothetical protein [unclassified Pseudomonas]